MLVKFDYNCGDEFDTAGFKIMTQEEYYLMLACAREYCIQCSGTQYIVPEYTWGTHWEGTEDIEMYFGTNEYIMLKDYEEYMEGISVINTSPEEDAMIIKNFGGDYGFTYYLEY